MVRVGPGLMGQPEHKFLHRNVSLSNLTWIFCNLHQIICLLTIPVILKLALLMNHAFWCTHSPRATQVTKCKLWSLASWASLFNAVTLYTHKCRSESTIRWMSQLSRWSLHQLTGTKPHCHSQSLHVLRRRNAGIFIPKVSLALRTALSV
jgi:hypothetical protein